MKILIIEDEKITADDLARSLKAVRPQYEIVKSTTSIKNTIEFLQTEPILDLIFSDIQLSDGLSFDVFKKVEVTVPVIFCTAYDQYALKAFDANGIAYVLKPFSTESIEKALVKFESLTQQNHNKLSQLLQLMEQSRLQSANAALLIYQGEKIIPVNFEDIAVIYLQDGLVRLHTFDHQTYTASETLEELTRIQNPDFFRVNRQHLVHRKAIKNAAKYFNRRLVLQLTFPFKEKLIISKEKASSFLDWLSQG